MNRREFLRVGALTAFGLNAGDMVGAPGKRKSCILVWLEGGASHLDTFDPKPDAPAEVRGPFGSVTTRVPAVRLCEELPQLASRLDRVSLIRSLTSPLGEHNLGAHYVLTGYPPTPALTYPSIGSVMAHLQPGRSALPPYVAVPDAVPQAQAGFLPGSCRPFEVLGDPGRPDFRVRDLDPRDGLSREALERRRTFRQAIDRMGQLLEDSAEDPHLEQAYRLILSDQAKQAFDLSREPAGVRQRYGTRTLGQSCLLARRLIEAGVPFVTVTDHGWDTHDRLVNRLKEGYTGGHVGKVPLLDQALSTLLDDLGQRGLLESTLVLVVGEFGRTPRINTQGGRDHWPRVFSALLAGGGTRPGVVVGRSDSRGEAPADGAATPADLACTVYEVLGVRPTQELRTTDGRPVRVRPEGKVIRELV